MNISRDTECVVGGQIHRGKTQEDKARNGGRKEGRKEINRRRAALSVEKAGPVDSCRARYANRHDEVYLGEELLNLRYLLADSEVGKVIRCYPGALIYDSGRRSEQAHTQTE